MLLVQGHRGNIKLNPDLDIVKESERWCITGNGESLGVFNSSTEACAAMSKMRMLIKKYIDRTNIYVVVPHSQGGADDGE